MHVNDFFDKSRDMSYDYIIVGGGPAGLTVAWILSQQKNVKKILIIERETSLGGCHRVRRTPEGMFTEHGPRIYSDAYKTFTSILKTMNIEYHNIFTPYNFEIDSIGKKVVLNFQWHELFWLIFHYLVFLVSKSYSKRVSMLTFMTNYSFTSTSIDYIDHLCRLTDGAGADKYTLHEFYQLPNQNMLYTISQPRRPNDVGLFHLWRNKLLETGKVDIVLNTKVVKLDYEKRCIRRGPRTLSTLYTNNSNYSKIATSNSKIILAIPPKNIVELSSLSQIDAFPISNISNMKVWESDNRYMTYIPMTYHWKKKINIPKIWGLSASEWGVVFIAISDYTQFSHFLSQTVLSVAITRADVQSSVTGKTANQSSKDELLYETFRQLKIVMPNLPRPDRWVLSPGVYKNLQHKWCTKDTAFMETPASYMRHLPLQSDSFKNLYNVGTHNGKHKYHFTSLESAVSNAVALCHKLDPQTQSQFPILEPWSLEHVIKLVAFGTVSFIVGYKMYRR